MTASVPAKQSISSNRKRRAGLAFVLTLGLFLVIAYLFFAGYGNYVTQSQFYAILAVDALLFSFGIFSLIKSKLVALMVSLGMLSAFVVIFVALIFFFGFFTTTFSPLLLTPSGSRY